MKILAGRNVPSIMTEPANEAITVSLQMAMGCEAVDMILTRINSGCQLQIQSAQHLDLVALDIDRKKIERHRRRPPLRGCCRASASAPP